VKVPPVLVEGLYILEGEPQLTEVNIQVKENIIQKTLRDVPIKIENTSPFIFCEIEPQNAEIIIEGKNILIDEIEKEDIKVFVKFTENLKINQEIKLEVQLPEGVSLIKVEPEEVNLKINSE
jgi:YbbR domain-containing protein